MYCNFLELNQNVVLPTSVLTERQFKNLRDAKNHLLYLSRIKKWKITSYVWNDYEISEASLSCVVPIVASINLYVWKFSWLSVNHWAKLCISNFHNIPVTTTFWLLSDQNTCPLTSWYNDTRTQAVISITIHCWADVEAILCSTWIATMEPNTRYALTILTAVTTSRQVDDVCPIFLKYLWLEVKLHLISARKLWNGMQQCVSFIKSWMEITDGI